MQDYNLERLSWPKSIIGKHRLLIGPPVASAGIRSEINPPRPCALRRVDALTKFQTFRALKLLNCFRFAHPVSAYPQQPIFYPIFDPHAHRQIIDGHLESSARKRKKKRKRQTQQTASILLSPQAGFRLVHSFFGLSRPLIGVVFFLSFIKNRKFQLVASNL